MRTETIIKTWLQFDELSDSAKDKAISKYSSINVDLDWWEFTYDDMKTVGIQCRGFDINRGSYCEIKFLWNAEQVADEILKNHGDTCETYKLAAQFKKDILENSNKTYDEHEDVAELSQNEYHELAEQFKKYLSEEYLSMLRREYEYLTSDEAIKETILANEYEFDSEDYEAAK